RRAHWSEPATRRPSRRTSGFGRAGSTRRSHAPRRATVGERWGRRRVRGRFLGRRTSSCSWSPSLRSAVRVDAPNEGMRRPPVLRPFGGGHVSAGVLRTLRAGLSVWNREKGEQDHISPVKTLQTGWWYVPARTTFTWWYGPVSDRLAVSDDCTSSLLRPQHGGVLERVRAQDHEVCCGPHGDPPEVGTAEQVGVDRRGRTQRIEYAV